MKVISTLAALLLATGTTWAQAPATAGEVTKIDKPAGRITLRHGEIRNLDMPAMTMVFRVADPRLLDVAKVGERVKFTADKRNGQLTVLTLERAD